MADKVVLAQIERQYCPPLDSALVLAISADYELANPTSLARFRETLDELCESAEVEAAIDSLDGTNDNYGARRFSSDPGVGSSAAMTDKGTETGTGGFGTESVEESVYSETDTTSVSNGLCSLAIGARTTTNRSGSTLNEEETDSFENDNNGDGVETSEADKITALCAMFPAINEYNITYVLRKCAGRIDAASDELLNHEYFTSNENAQQEGSVSRKGVDAFAADDGWMRVGRKKVKEQKRRSELHVRDTNAQRPSSASMPSSPSRSSVNSWKDGQAEISLICSMTGLDHGKVSTLFYRHGASRARTVEALCEDISTTPLDDPTDVNALASHLGTKCPHLSPERLVAIVRLSGSDLTKAFVLVDALAPSNTTIRYATPPASHSGSRSGSGTEHDLDGNNENAGWTTVTRRNSNYDTSLADATAKAQVHGRREAQAREQASAAARRGKSDHNMFGAAGYYGQVVRDEAKLRREATAAAADALVDMQSSRNQIDLHGVSVSDAVRLARSRTVEWWKTNGRRVKGLDGRVVREEDGGGRVPQFRIVTGVGRHSSDGVAKIGPAVGRALVTDGWVVSEQGGVWTVHGRGK